MTTAQLHIETELFINHVKANYDPSRPLMFWIDLFCGAGGTSTGIQFANTPNMFVAACVNHDKNAILSHAANHPHTLHFTEDIRDFEVVQKLKYLIERLRIEFPGCILNLWASLECTNFSKAKGGQARDADSRTLAEHMFMYLDLDFDYFWVENVREFMSWGPLDEKGKPVSRTAGRDYLNWIDKVRSYGFSYDAKILNSADYGAYQSRQRLFIQFAKKGFPVTWPDQTHTKDKIDSPLFPMEKWKPVREVLDLHDEGVSIFERKKELSENTLKRIYAGLVKFVAKGKPEMTMQYNSGSDSHRMKSVDEPIGTITTGNSHAVVKSVFIKKYFSGRPEGKVISIEGPGGTVKCIDGQALVTATHLNTYYGNGGVHSVDEPAPTVTTKDRICKIDAQFLMDYQFKSNAHSLDNPNPTLVTKDKFALVTGTTFVDQQYGNSEPADIEKPIGTLTANPKFALVNTQPWIMNPNFNNVGKSIDDPMFTLVASRRHPYIINANSSTSPPLELETPSPSVTSRTHLLVNPAWGGNINTVDQPCCTVVARQDKAPLYLLSAERGNVACYIYESDSEIMIKIKTFMVEYGIVDIKMRMLKITELKQIQGLPIDYKLIGTQTEQKKYLGNAVERKQATAITQNLYNVVEIHFKNAA